MTYVVLWLFCGLVTAIIGSRKGEGCAGFIFGILLGPFGILFAIYSRGNRVECPFCKELIHNEAVTCPHCQNPIVRANVEKKTGSSSTQAILVVLGMLVVLFFVIPNLSAPSQSTKNSGEPSADNQNDANNDAIVSDDSASKDKELMAAYNKSLAKFKENLKDPYKLKGIECLGVKLGVKLYNDPQPPGHPPSPEECARIQAEEENHQNKSDLNVSAGQEPLEYMLPYTNAAESLDQTCNSAPNGSTEKVKACSQRDGVVEMLKNYGWCWNHDPEVESNKRWYKCDGVQNSNAEELQNNPAPSPPIDSSDGRSESISEVKPSTKEGTENIDSSTDVQKSSSLTPQVASFNCAKAKSKSEILICNDPDLSKLDGELAISYRDAQAKAADGEAFKKETLTAWKWRESNCRDKECLLNWYADRKVTLEKVRLEDSCIDMLRQGMMYKSVMQICNYKGDAKAVLMKKYDAKECRKKIQQSTVEKEAAKILDYLKKDFQTLGEEQFCTNYSSEYYKVLSENTTK